MKTTIFTACIKKLTLFILMLLIASPLAAQDLRVVFAANLDNSGGLNGSDNSGADLYSVRFNPHTQTVSELQRLTATATEVEFFPSLSPDAKWVAYNHQNGGRNEIRLLHLESKKVTGIFSGGRFPEWVNANDLLATYVSRDTQDVFLLKLDLSGATPRVVSRQQVTDRTRCPDTSIGSDAFPFANGSRLVFHVLRPNRQTGAAMAMINTDGTGYRRLTDWNGSGHGVATNDGRYVASSNSQNGKAVLLEVQSDTVLFNYLALSPFGKDLSKYDSRYANVPVCSYAYQAWGADERSLFHSVTGNNQNAGVALTRVLYTIFDAQWQNPQIVDFSTAVEKLAGKSGRDFSTCSARLIASPPTTGVVYVTLAMHNEDTNSRNYPNYATSQSSYLAARSILLEFGKMIQRHQIAFNWESDWNFLIGVLKWDTPSVTATTNGKNLVRYLKEDLGLSVDPHSHENNGYNYADVAHLLDSLGVPPTNVVGGHVWDPGEAGYQNWERFKQPLNGSKFPWAQWKGDILMGSATGLHRNDPKPTGVWRPTDKYHFWEDDPNGNVMAVGQYATGATAANVQELVNMYKSGAVPPDKILTATLVIGQHFLNAQYLADYETNTLKPLLEMQARGEIKLVTFGELLDEWKTKYNSAPHLILSSTTAVEEDQSSAPSGFVLAQNYPNPFWSGATSRSAGNPSTVISFQLSVNSHVTLQVFDVNGREVATLVDGEMAAGKHAMAFAPRDLAGGLYFYKFTAGKFSQTRKAVLLK